MHIALGPPNVLEILLTLDKLMQEMIVYQFYQTPVMLISLTALVDRVMASGTMYNHACILINFLVACIVLSSCFDLICSVGSLGGGGTTALVERITVSNCSFYKTLTGVRIKSWQVTLNRHLIHALCITAPCMFSKIFIDGCI